MRGDRALRVAATAGGAPGSCRLLGRRGCAVGQRQAASRIRWGRARVRRAVVGNDPWRRARPELPRGPPWTRGFGAGGDHRPCAANVVCVACSGRSAPLRAHEHSRARPPRAAAGTRAASGRRPRVASATGRAAWARDRLRRARVALAPRSARPPPRGGRPHRRPAGRDRWRRRPVAHARGVDPCPRHDGGTSPPARRDRARRGLGNRSTVA